MPGLRLRWYHKLLSHTLRCGPIPHHVAFVMDGNRRFARRFNNAAMAGHERGYDALLDVIDYCAHLGVQIVTVYAFSLDNFKRANSEVTGLMTLATAKFSEMLTHLGLVDSHGARICVLGDLGRLPPEVQTAATDVMERTAGNSQLLLNICFSYSAHLEVAHAISRVIAEPGPDTDLPADALPLCVPAAPSAPSAADESACPETSGAPCLSSAPADPLAESTGVAAPAHARTQARRQAPEPAVLHALERSLYTSGMPEPDLLVRTSGESRLSDFLLWQSGHTHLCFVPRLWPEFTYWDWVRIVLGYQAAWPALQRARAAAVSAQEQALRCPGGLGTAPAAPQASVVL